MGKLKRREVLDKIGYAKDPKVLGKHFEVKGLDTPMLPQRWILVDSITEK